MVIGQFDRNNGSSLHHIANEYSLMMIEKEAAAAAAAAPGTTTTSATHLSSSEYIEEDMFTTGRSPVADIAMSQHTE
jgi:hypothetical protein